MKRSSGELRLVREISPKQKEWRNSKEIMMYTRGSEILSDKDQDKWLTRIGEDKSLHFFGIEVEEKSTVPGWKKRPAIVGTCGLSDYSAIHRTAEFSLLIGPEYHRKGYGERALRELLTYGFDNLGLRIIWGETFVGNPAQKLFEKLGFVKTGVHRERYYKFGKVVDAICFDMKKEEWDDFRAGLRGGTHWLGSGAVSSTTIDPEYVFTVSPAT